MRLRFVLTLTAALFAGCSGQASPPLTEAITPAATAVAIATAETATPAALPTAEVTPDAPIRLMIWLPEPLNPLGNTLVNDLVDEQFAAFEATNSNIEVGWRRKRVGDVGGIMSTLRTASAVAPGALPDLTLIRREDLLTAVSLGLIQPLEGRAATAIIGDLYGAALRLGQVNGQLYGLPYMLEVQHVVYRPTLTLSGWSFEDILTGGVPFVFPAARANGVNDVLLIQYLSALPPELASELENGELPMDAETLLTVLSFYEEAVAAGIVSPGALDLSAPINYADLVGDSVTFVTSTAYLDLVTQGEALAFAPIPTESGESVTLVNGWMWVLTTTNAERQEVAIEFLNWLMDATRQNEYSAAIHMIPSQRSTLRLWQDEAYSEFVGELLDNALLPVPESTNARALQNAFSAVLLGRSTAEEATQNILEQVGG